MLITLATYPVGMLMWWLQHLWRSNGQVERWMDGWMDGWTLLIPSWENFGIAAAFTYIKDISNTLK